MNPISKIKVGDCFQNPLFGNEGNINRVMDIELSENMVLIQAFRPNGKEIMKPFWIKYTHRMFNENWRIIK